MKLLSFSVHESVTVPESNVAVKFEGGSGTDDTLSNPITLYEVLPAIAAESSSLVSLIF